MNLTTEKRRPRQTSVSGAPLWRRLASLYASSVGRKFVMALSGSLLGSLPVSLPNAVVQSALAKLEQVSCDHERLYPGEQ